MRNVRALEYLVALDEERNFTRAAQRAHVSQPTLSAQVKKLEEGLGAQLVERGTQQVLITPVGRDVVYYARRILTDLDHIEQVSRSGSNPLVATITIGVFPTIAPYLLPRFAPALGKALPDLTAHFVEEKSLALMDALASGRIDAAVLADTSPESGLTVAHLFDEDFVLATSSTSALGEQTAPVDLGDLADHEVILLEEGHCMRRSTVSICEKVGARQSAFRATSLETLRYMVAAGSGVTLLPRLATIPPIAQPDGLVLREFCPPRPYRSINLVWRRSSPLDELNATIADLISSLVAPVSHAMEEQ